MTEVNTNDFEQTLLKGLINQTPYDAENVFLSFTLNDLYVFHKEFNQMLRKHGFSCNWKFCDNQETILYLRVDVEAPIDSWAMQWKSGKMVV